MNINGNEKSEFYSIQLQCHSTSHSTQPNPWMDPTHVHLCLITPPTSPDRGAEYCDERVCRCVCLCVCVCLSAMISAELHLRSSPIFVHVIYGRGKSVFASEDTKISPTTRNVWRSSDVLRINGFVDDVIFAHKLIGCSTSPPGWGSEACRIVIPVAGRQVARDYLQSLRAY